MKWLLITLLFLVGCVEETPQRPKSTVFTSIAQTNGKATLTIQDLGVKNGHWELLELEFDGTTHVILRNYDSNNQSLLKIAEIKKTAEKPEK
jgi:hypothetical protein